MKKTSSALAAVAFVLVARHASASPCTDAEAAAARARAKFDSGAFVEAATMLEDAYRMCPRPGVLYNLGRVYQQLGQLEKAVDAFSRYVAMDPKAPDNGATQTVIQKLREQLAQREALEHKVVDEAEDRRLALERAREAENNKRLLELRVRQRPRAPPWITLGLGVATLAGGAILTGLAFDRHAAAQSNPDAMSAFGQQQNAVTFAASGYAALAVGGVATVVGAIWAIVDVCARAHLRIGSIAIRF